MGERLHGRVPEGDCLAINWPDTSRPRVRGGRKQDRLCPPRGGVLRDRRGLAPRGVDKGRRRSVARPGCLQLQHDARGTRSPRWLGRPQVCAHSALLGGPPPDLTSAPCGLGRSRARPTDTVAGPGPQLCHVTGSHGRSFPQGAATPSAGGPSSGAEHVRAALGTGEGSEGAGGLRLDARGGPRSQPLGLLPLGGGTDATQRAVAAPRWACRDPRGLQPGLGPTGCPSPGMWRSIGRAGSHGRNKQSGVRCYFETH